MLLRSCLVYPSKEKMMYLHLVPRILHHMKNKCTLVSVSVPELSLELKADSLVAMKPYPNKSYHVVMLKGRRALNGFLVKAHGL